MVKCDNCGASIEESDNFCMNCGNKIEKNNETSHNIHMKMIYYIHEKRN